MGPAGSGPKNSASGFGKFEGTQPSLSEAIGFQNDAAPGRRLTSAGDHGSGNGVKRGTCKFAFHFPASRGPVGTKEPC
jgi:hypothetical protein